MKSMNRFSMILVKNTVNFFRRFERFIKSLKKICLNLVTVVERRLEEVIWFVKSFSIFWG